MRLSSGSRCARRWTRSRRRRFPATSNGSTSRRCGWTSSEAGRCCSSSSTSVAWVVAAHAALHAGVARALRRTTACASVGVHCPGYEPSRDVPAGTRSRREARLSSTRLPRPRSSRSGSSTATRAGRRATCSTARAGSSYFHYGEGAYAETEAAGGRSCSRSRVALLEPLRPEDDPDAHDRGADARAGGRVRGRLRGRRRVGRAVGRGVSCGSPGARSRSPIPAPNRSSSTSTRAGRARPRDRRRRDVPRHVLHAGEGGGAEPGPSADRARSSGLTAARRLTRRGGSPSTSSTAPPGQYGLRDASPAEWWGPRSTHGAGVHHAGAPFRGVVLRSRARSGVCGRRRSWPRRSPGAAAASWIPCSWPRRSATARRGPRGTGPTPARVDARDRQREGGPRSPARSGRRGPVAASGRGHVRPAARCRGPAGRPWHERRSHRAPRRSERAPPRSRQARRRGRAARRACGPGHPRLEPLVGRHCAVHVEVVAVRGVNAVGQPQSGIGDLHVRRRERAAATSPAYGEAGRRRRPVVKRQRAAALLRPRAHEEVVVVAGDEHDLAPGHRGCRSPRAPSARPRAPPARAPGEARRRHRGARAGRRRPVPRRTPRERRAGAGRRRCCVLPGADRKQ